jgi:hypothetical protein
MATVQVRSAAMVHGYLLEGMPLGFAQLEDAFHGTAIELESYSIAKIVYPEHLVRPPMLPLSDCDGMRHSCVAPRDQRGHGLPA